MVMISYALISEIVRGGTNIIKGLRDILVEEQVRLENIIKMAEDRMKHAPRGNLKLSKTKDFIQYYLYDEDDKSASYISKKENDLVCKLAQKSYDKKVLELVGKRLSQIRKITKDYTDDVNVNIKMYKKWKIIMYIFSVILPLRMTQKALAYL